jgi:lipopolysaccharide export system protein LptA
LLLALLCFSSTLSAQIVSRGFRLFDYYDAVPGKNQTNLLKSQITGAEARPQANGLELITRVRIENYLEDGRTNLIAIAPECLVDSRSRVAFSAGPLEVVTANGQLTVQGKGFFYQQTNFNLAISNQVETTIHRELMRSTNASAGSFPGFPTTNAIGTNQLMKIFSEHFFLETSSNLAIYAGEVRIADAQMEMICDTLAIRRGTNGSVERIVADQHVVMTNKVDQSQAMGDRAVYSLEPDHETVVLTGQQARWQDRDREARAGSFTFDRRANTLRAVQKPSMKLPRAALGQPDWLAGKPAASPSAPALTNQFVEITAAEMFMQLPTTNQPARRLTAETEVVVISPADNSRATGDRAVYEEAAGTVELRGHAVWQSNDRLIKGDTLTFDRTNKVFSARGNAYLAMPLSALGRQAPVPSGRQPPVAERVEAFSDDFVYQPDALSFHENVRAKYFQGEVLHGGLTCGSLRLGFNSNRLDSVLAKGSVALDQPFVGTNDARRIEKKLNCESLALHFHTNGLIQSALAEMNVVARQTETRRGRPLPIQTDLLADQVAVWFFDHTNQVREIIAERRVSIVQGDRKAHGEKAVYSATNNSVVLTGHPTAETPMGRITEAEALLWDRTRNTLKASRKVVGDVEVPAKGTNSGPFRLR